MSAMRISHQMFLQSFMSRGVLDAKEVKLLFKICCDRAKLDPGETEDDRKRKLQDFVMLINSNLKSLHMEIKKGVSEDDGSNHYCLVNLGDSPITKLASDYTTNELELFKKMVEGIVTSDTPGELYMVDALLLTDKLDKKMPKSDAENFLEKLQRDKWIKKHHGKLSLDTRAVIELEHYILDMYPGVAEKCNMCKRICLKGQCCDSCNCKVHLHCARVLFLKQDVPRCPKVGCGAPWQYEVPRKVSAATEGEASQSATQNERPANTQTRKRKLRS